MLTSRQSNVFPSRGAKGSSLTARFVLDVSDEISDWFCKPDSTLVTAAISSVGFIIAMFVFLSFLVYTFITLSVRGLEMEEILFGFWFLFFCDRFFIL